MPRARIQGDIGRFAAIPARQYLFKTAGSEILSNVDLRLQHDTEAGEGPVMHDVVVIDAQPSGRCKTGCRAFGTSEMPGAGNVSVANELMARRFRGRRRPSGAIRGLMPF